MRLLDQIAVAKTPLVVRQHCGTQFTLPGLQDLTGALLAAPVRYVLDDVVAAFAAQTAFGDPDRFGHCIELLRLPAARFWVEWCEHGRRAVMAQLGLTTALAAATAGGRAGALIESDDSGRRGTISFAWTTGPHDTEGTLAPLVVDFDLDDPDFRARKIPDAVTRGAEVNGAPALTHFLRHVRFRLRCDWRDYYARTAPTPQAFTAALDANIGQVVAAIPFLLAFCLGLSARNALTLAPSALDRLNKSRRQHGRAPLLDHIEVTARFGGARASGGAASARADARLHFVCGHLVRRGQQIFWRRPHLRGNAARGAIIARNIQVRSVPDTPIDPRQASWPRTAHG